MHSHTVKIGGLVGTLTRPDTESKQIAYLLHGLGGHRDYCYQKMLAEALTHRFGWCTFRFDFRGCGDSQDVENPQTGRTVLGTDQQDLQAVLDYFVGYTTICMIGHSRGVAIMFSWALLKKPSSVPLWVNCSGRYDCSQIWGRLESQYPALRAERGYWSKAKRHGKQQSLWYPEEEVEEYANLKTEPYAEVPGQVLTVFGSSDHIVPTSAAGEWANLFGSRHTLKIVDGDHNFYGKRNGKHVNFNRLVVDAVCQWLEVQLHQGLPSALEGNRWPHVEGVANFRDFGGYRSARGGLVKRGRMFRSANLNRITAKGKQQIRALGITQIYDLRSPAELKRDRTRAPQIDGVTVHQCPVFDIQDWSPAAITERATKLESGIIEQYKEILDALVTSQVLAKVTRAIAGGERVLIHCTAGKDRTGVLCALILLGLGVDENVICRDYELTAIGYRQETIRLSAALKQLLPDISPEKIDAMMSSSAQTMFETLRLVHARGGVYRYFKDAGLAAVLQQLRSDCIFEQSRL